MPLIRNASDKAGGASPEALVSLAGASPDERWAAARAACDPAAIPSLAEALAHERAPRVREGIFTALARIATPESAQIVLPYLRVDDANMRTGAMDALRAMQDACRPYLPGLLTDPDPDVRLLACDLVGDLGGAYGPRWLCALIETEPGNQCLRRSRGSVGRDRGRGGGAGPFLVAPDVFQTIRSSVLRSRLSSIGWAACRRRRVVEFQPLDAGEERRLCDYLYRHTGMAFTEASALFPGTARRRPYDRDRIVLVSPAISRASPQTCRASWRN